MVSKKEKIKTPAAQKKFGTVEIIMVAALLLLIVSHAIYCLLDISHGVYAFSSFFSVNKILFFSGLQLQMPLLYHITNVIGFVITVLPYLALAVCAGIYRFKPTAGKVFLAITFVLWCVSLINQYLEGKFVYEMNTFFYNLRWDSFFDALGYGLHYITPVMIITAIVTVVLYIILHIPAVAVSLLKIKTNLPLIIVAALTSLLHCYPVIGALKALFVKYPYGHLDFLEVLQWWLYKGVNFLAVLLPAVIVSAVLITICVRLAPAPKKELASDAETEVQE